MFGLHIGLKDAVIIGGIGRWHQLEVGIERWLCKYTVMDFAFGCHWQAEFITKKFACTVNSLSAEMNEVIYFCVVEFHTYSSCFLGGGGAGSNNLSPVSDNRR